MKSIDAILKEFQIFLNLSVPQINRIQTLAESDYDLLSDWMQANWEILVEALVCEPGQFLEVYGEGADCHGKSSRVSMKKALPTHEIYCLSKASNKLIDVMTRNAVDVSTMSFYSFVSWDGRYSFEPPLSYILLESKGKQAIVHAEEVIFKIKSI